MVNFEAASSNSLRYIQKNNFVTVAEADIDDSSKQKRIRVSLRKRDCRRKKTGGWLPEALLALEPVSQTESLMIQMAC